MSDAATLKIIAEHLDDELDLASVRGGNGSSLNKTILVDGRKADYFVKLNTARFTSMMEAEYAGLQELRRAAAVRVPIPFVAGRAGASSFIAMERLAIGAADRATHARFGRQLAQLHQHTKQQFGWHRDNTIGLTPQSNTCSDDWGGFFREQRLGVQLERLQNQGVGHELVARGQELQQRLPAFFADDSTTPSLLHGDLWGGNWGALGDGTPVMFDPAVYYGDAESDIAMTRLFGGFDEQFYDAYREIHPDTAHGALRRELYRLYHLLNHCNLFGGSYHAQTNQVLCHLLKNL